MELSTPNLKKLLVFQERALKYLAKKNSYFLRVSKNKFIKASFCYFFFSF